jgi:hypothetical protein
MLLREADAAHGWQLKQKANEVTRVKKVSEAKVSRLSSAKINLLAEVRAVKTSSQEVLLTAKEQHKDHVTKLIMQVKAGITGIDE